MVEEALRKIPASAPPFEVKRKGSNSPLVNSSMVMNVMIQNEKSNSAQLYRLLRASEVTLSLTSPFDLITITVQRTKLCRCEVRHESVAMASNRNAAEKKEGS
ncbi:hypothetical protein EVAR_11350_1 [Eumeta japonica]|uniref:Uncharacterized protein n=1 Tax=Eumeta variegata TaxID=151549 RepID=A0A4C1U150_EUMVA|nr:hypothetical protein EVAR_11350_1 [Eumeta japonica]